jgi:hypothetical protein
MKIRARFSLPLASAALVLALPLVTSADSTLPNEADTTAAKQSIQDIRNVGTAMYNWYKTEMAPKRSPESHNKAEEAAKAPSVDISAIPAISREDLAKVLVPKYIAAIPEKDCWVHPYDFHLDTKNPDAIPVMGLRSAGRDGKFSGNVYEVGGFSPADADQDISWVDGYFVRWPEK